MQQGLVQRYRASSRTAWSGPEAGPLPRQGGCKHLTHTHQSSRAFADLFRRLRARTTTNDSSSLLHWNRTPRCVSADNSQITTPNSHSHNAMDADRPRHHVSELYHAALARTLEEREVFLNEVCAGDEALGQEIESLLQYDSASARFLRDAGCGTS